MVRADKRFKALLAFHSSYLGGLQECTPKCGWRVFHFPRVKSGNATGALPFAIDCSDSAMGAHIRTES